MNKTTTNRHNLPVNDPVDPEVLAFRRQFDDHSRKVKKLSRAICHDILEFSARVLAT